MSSLIPTFRYRDAHGAIEFLCAAFGFERHAVIDGPDGTVAHAELRLGDDVVMVGSARPDGQDDPLGLQPGGGSVYVVLDEAVDVEAHHARAVAAGARAVQTPHDTYYGSREHTVRDPDGNLWSFGTYDPLAV